MITVRSIDAVRRLGLSTIAMVVAGAAMTPAQAGPEKAGQPRLGNGEAVKVAPRFQSLMEGKKVLSIVQVVIAPGVTEHRHRHPGLEIVYVLNGLGPLTLELAANSSPKWMANVAKNAGRKLPASHMKARRACCGSHQCRRLSLGLSIIRSTCISLSGLRTV